MPKNLTAIIRVNDSCPIQFSSFNFQLCECRSKKVLKVRNHRIEITISKRASCVCCFLGLLMKQFSDLFLPQASPDKQATAASTYWGQITSEGSFHLSFVNIVF